MHAASHPVEQFDVQAPHWNPQLLAHEVQYEEHASEHNDVQDDAMQFNLQLASHAPEDSIPHIHLHPQPTQFLLQSC